MTKEDKGPGGGEEEKEVWGGERLPAPTWLGRQRQALEDGLAHYSSLLEELDLYCDIKNKIQKGLSVQVSKPTPLGGGVSITFVGVLLAVCAMLIEQFVLSNSAAVTSSIMLTEWEIGTLARYPPYVGDYPDLAALLPGPGMASGLQVTIRTHGDLCAAPLSVRGLMAVSNFTARAPLINSTTDAVTHVYDCTECLADSLSSLTLAFDPSCASFDITAAAMGAWGTFSMLQVTAPNVSGLSGSFSVLPQQVVDFVGGSDPTASGFPTGGRSARGIFIDSGVLLSTLPYSATAVAAGTAPPTVLILTFPATALFTRVTLDVRLTILDLINGLLGNLGVLGGATVLYAILAQLYDSCAQRLTEQGKGLAQGMEHSAQGAVVEGAHLVGKGMQSVGRAMETAAAPGAVAGSVLKGLGVKDAKAAGALATGAALGAGGMLYAVARSGSAGSSAGSSGREKGAAGGGGGGAGSQVAGISTAAAPAALMSPAAAFSTGGRLSAAATSGTAAAGAPTSYWQSDTDGVEHWVFEVSTGETAWEIPPGGVLLQQQQQQQEAHSYENPLHFRAPGDSGKLGRLPPGWLAKQSRRSGGGGGKQ